MYAFGKINTYIGTLDLKKIVKEADLDKVEEAVHVCDLSTLAKKYKIWMEYMPRIKPYYAVKCNDDAIVVKELVDLGTGFDCASKSEIKLALESGANPEDIIFAHPCKPVVHLQYAKEKKVMTTTVDTEYEIYKIFKHFPESNLLIRFRSEAKEAQYPLGDKFGCDAEADAPALMLLAKSLKLAVIGTSFHVGSGCNEPPAYSRAIATAKNLFKYGETLGYDMRVLDIGGGFPGADVEKFATIAEIIKGAIEEHFRDENVEIIAEPGRYFVAEAYTSICKIHGKREVRTDKKTDLKMYFLNNGVFGTFHSSHIPQEIIKPEHLLDETENIQKFKSVIWGPTCDPKDKIIEDVYLPNLSCGDFIAFRNMGAYTVPHMSPFNGFPVPKTLFFKALE